MLLKKLLGFVEEQGEVEIVGPRAVPWEASSAHSERANSHGEEIVLLAIKWCLEDDLRAHVVFSAAETGEKVVLVGANRLL